MKPEAVFDVPREGRRVAHRQLRDELRDEYNMLAVRDRNLAARERHGLADRLHFDERVDCVGRERVRQDGEVEALRGDREAYEERAFAKHLLAVLLGSYDEAVASGRPTCSCHPDLGNRAELVARAAAVRLAELNEASG